MSEQLYYTFSNIGSGPTNGERIRAQSPGIGSATSEPVRALMKYLTYRLPAGADARTPVESAPLSLVLAQTPFARILAHKKYVVRDGIGRGGNFFTHAIINPELMISAQTGVVDPVSPYEAICLWKSPFWKTSEEQISVKGVELPGVTPEELSRAIDSFDSSPKFDPKNVAEYLPLIFSAFLMLEKLKKTQLYVAAPAEMVATLIWCITRCLPNTLDSMRNLTFSTYEYEIAKSTTTITGTCWLPPTHQSGPFVPQNDLPAICYQPQAANPVLAVNCYTGRKTPFEIDAQVKNFVQFATQALLQQDFKLLDKLHMRAERKRYQKVDDFLALFRIQQEKVTRETVQNILTNPQLWHCLLDSPIQDKLIELLKDIQYLPWRPWWKAQGMKQLQLLYQYALKQPQSEEAEALSAFADRVMSELCQELATESLGQGSIEWVDSCDNLLKSISTPTSDLVLWSTLPQRLSKLHYNSTYGSWWQSSGKTVATKLYEISTQNMQVEVYQRLKGPLDQWWQQSATCLIQTWWQRQDKEMDFWVDILQTIQPPIKGSQNWRMLLNELDKAAPEGKSPAHCCEWDIFQFLLLAWSEVLTPQQLLPRRWLDISWGDMPHLLAIAALPEEWRQIALADRIQQFQGTMSAQMVSYIMECSPRVEQVLAQMLSDEHKRAQALWFSESLFQQKYKPRDVLLENILPVLLPYQAHLERIVNVAGLSVAQLNAYIEGRIYKELTSRQDIPAWLIPRLESYLVNFHFHTLNPDYQDVTPEKRHMIHAIFDVLIKRNQLLPEVLHPYLFCWNGIYEFFDFPIFYPEKLQVIGNQIKKLSLGQEKRQELNYEMIAFLSKHVKAELELGRVIDNLGEVLIQPTGNPIPPNVQLLREMVRLIGERMKTNYSSVNTVIYIKAILCEADTLSQLKFSAEIVTSFVNECLDSLLLYVQQLLYQKFSTDQWPPHIVERWKSYQSQRSKRKSIVPSLSTQSSTAVMANSGSRFDFANIEETLKNFNKAIKSKQVDKIAYAYQKSLDPRLSPEQIRLASMAQELMQTYEEGKKTGNYNAFILKYNAYEGKFNFSGDIKDTIDWLYVEQEKKKK